jgi:oligosaccharide repeat unit polymerase
MKSMWSRPADILSIGLTREDLYSAAVLAIMAIFAFALWQFPAAGIHLVEVGFPLIAVWILYHNRSDLFAPGASFPALYLLWFWLGTITIVPANDLNSLLNPFDEHQWLLYVIGFIGLWCGLYTFRGEKKDCDRLRGVSAQWNDGLFLLLIAATTAIFLIAWAIIVSKEGITILKDDVETLRVSVSTDNHITFQILMLSKLIFPLIYLYSWTASPKPLFKKTLYTLGIVIVLILTSTGNRGMALDSLLIVFATRHYVRKRYKTWHLFLAAAILSLALSLSGYYRAVQHGGTSHADQLTRMGFPPAVQPFTDIYLYVRSPADTLRNVTKQIPANTPYQHGTLTTSALTQLLPGRHPSTDFYFKDLVGGQYDGLGQPASILGPFYADFGLLGVFLGMFFSGLASRFLYIKMFQGSFTSLLLYCCFWQLLVGSLYGALFIYIIQILIPIAWIMILWLVVNKVSYRRPSPTIVQPRFAPIPPAPPGPIFLSTL